MNGKSTLPWTKAAALALFAKPFLELIYDAHGIHREYFPAKDMQLSTLLNIKSGGCPEDCHYCPQAARYHTGLKAQKLMSCETVISAAQNAKLAGATRFCMGAAWRELKDRDLPAIIDMIKAVKGLGLETCLTLGMLNKPQAESLEAAGLDYYNHNLDTSKDYYEEIITTRTYDDRLTTLGHVRDAGMKVCCGGIIGMGETREDRAELLRTLANLQPQPESVPINQLVRVPGTPLANADDLDPFEFVRTIAVARIMIPAARVRLSAGRTEMSDELQALCFFAGANSLFYGEKLLTTPNPESLHDKILLERLNIATSTA